LSWHNPLVQTPVTDAVSRLPAAPGVYRFRDAGGRALYIGRAGDLRRRVRSYWGLLRDRRHLRRMVPRIAAVEAVVCDSEHEAAWLERNLLEHRKPSWNRVRGGLEVPVHIRLDERRGSASLSVVHLADGPARHFGPYLGGLKVRLAVAGLHRALSLSYAGDRLTGSEADMARARGVAPGSRPELVRTAIAVLERDPAAVLSVRGELVRRRDEAATALLFERAARIQDEVEALEWVTAPQRVTTARPDDVDVHGFAGGVLVSFEIRGGRLRAWSQRPSTPVAAGPKLAATRPEWTDFVQRAADLAALLASVTAAGR
jgi:excinuclease ABC subunit C